MPLFLYFCYWSSRDVKANTLFSFENDHSLHFGINILTQKLFKFFPSRTNVWHFNRALQITVTKPAFELLKECWSTDVAPEKWARAAGGPLRKGGKSLGSRQSWVHILILLCFCPVTLDLLPRLSESQSLCSKQGRCARVTGVPEGLGFSQCLLTDSSVHAPSCPTLRPCGL